MARDIKEIIEGVDAAKLAEFAAKAAQCGSAQDIVALAAEYGKEIALDEAEGILADFQKKAQEEIALDEVDNVAGGCEPAPCPEDDAYKPVQPWHC